MMSQTPTDTLRVISPHTEQVIAQVRASTSEDVECAVLAARRALESTAWRRTTSTERIALIRHLADIYDRRRGEMASTISTEIGAPISFAQRAQVGLPATMIRAFCDLAEGHQFQVDRAGFFGADVRVRKEPVGVVAAVVPWNMPQFLIITKLIPALLAGCTVVLKPAPESPLNAVLLGEMLAEAGVPDGVVSIVIGGSAVGEVLVAHPGVDKVSFTGSTAAGRAVAGACAANLTKVSLELGGKSAAIVLGDAAPERVAAGIRSASLSNSGQICNALTRVLIPQARHDEYVEALAAEMDSLRVGDPSDPDTQLGPLVSRRQQQRVREYIRIGESEGAQLVTGGANMPGGLEAGWYVQPTLFARAENTMRIAREEIFGPVITVIAYQDEDDAIAIANDSEYGLAGSVWSEDTSRAIAIAERIRTGTVGINQGYTMDPFAPFGGVKGSGYGRELGHEGIDSYLETKSIAIATHF